MGWKNYQQEEERVRKKKRYLSKEFLDDLLAKHSGHVRFEKIKQRIVRELRSKGIIIKEAEGG